MKNNGVLLILPRAGDAAAAAAAERAFEGWRVARMDAATFGVADVACLSPDLILIDGGSHMVTAIRTSGDAIAHIPIVGLSGAFIPGADDHLAEPSEEGLASVARRWAPQSLPGLDRLAAALGAEEIHRLALGLRDQLEEALGTLDDHGGDPARAHRVAGFAGMLGLAELGQAWNALSHGRRDHVADLRIDTRRAIAALGRAGDRG